MFISETNLELLTTILVLGWPFRVVFSVVFGLNYNLMTPLNALYGNLLHNFTLFNYTFDLLDHERAHAH